MALCPQLPEYNAEVSERLGLEFPVLQDRDNAISTMFRLTIETPPEVVKAERSLGLDLPYAERQSMLGPADPVKICNRSKPEHSIRKLQC